MSARTRKCIALIMADIQSEYNRHIIRGIAHQTAALDYDVISFSYFSNHDIDMAFQHGEENILTLFQPEQFDGILTWKNSFRSQKVQDYITHLCINSGLPYLDADDYDPNAPFPIWNDRALFYDLVCHLIEVHRKKKIYCLTGPKELHQSVHRLAGYQDAMAAHGLYTDESYVFYGDFWLTGGESLADQIISGVVPKPDAIACAGSAMANALSNRLQENGIRVPEDIAIVGYDSFLENFLSTPSITAISNINYNQGVYLICNLHFQITGERCASTSIREECLECGTSCGCSDSHTQAFHKFKRELIEQQHHLDLIQVSCMLQRLTAAENLNDFWEALFHFLYLIRGMKTLSLCICEDWDGINKTTGDTYRNTGYSKKMLLFHATPESLTGIQNTFYSTDIIPAEQRRQNEASMYYCTPLHYDDRCFGYVVTEFQPSVISYDKLFWTWVTNVNAALESLRMQNYVRRFSNRIHLTAVRDPLTGLYNRRGFEELSAEMFEQAVLHDEKFFLMMIDIYNLKEITRKMGFEYSDNVMMTVAEAINQSTRGNEICCHTNDRHFYIIGSLNYTRNTGQQHEEMIQQYYATHLNDTESNIHVDIDIGYFCDKLKENTNLDDILAYVRNGIDQKRLQDKKRITYLNNFLDLRKSIYSQPERHWTVEEMSRMMMLSRAYFQRLYKKNFGVSAMTDVITARITAAKQLLTTSRKNIAEIAVLCGYESEIYFMQQFKKETGMTPSQYRRKQNS